MTRAELLAWSDERDQWERRLLAAERYGYRRGHRDGYRDGREAAHAEIARDWGEMARRVVKLATGPSHAELDRRRYPPDGRRSWLLTRSDDTGGGERGGLQDV